MEQLAQAEALELVNKYESISSLCLTRSGAKKCAVIAAKHIIAKAQQNLDELKKTYLDSIIHQAKIVETKEKITYYQLVITQINEL